MTGQSKKRKASQAKLEMMPLSDLPGEDDMEEAAIIKDVARNKVIQRTSAHHKILNARVQSIKAKASLIFLEKHGTQMVDIYVGEEKILFRVYKDLLCSKIEFFDRMFNGNFKEANQNTAELPEDDPEAFDMLMYWVTYDRIRSHMSEDFRKNLHLWVLADKLCLENLKLHVMDIWRGKDDEYDKYYTAEEFQYIFEKTASKSQPHEYAVRMLRFQSLKPPAEGLGYSIDYHGEPVPLSGLSLPDLTNILSKDEEILEGYLRLARTNDQSDNEMDPRWVPFY
ncbi:hypothetical protein EAE96_003919 [Botrytis aclada]|nr:hypothetical protein EAE96_003919 [Botrytis aclada]